MNAKIKVMAGNGRFYNPFDLTCTDFADIVPIATALSRIHRFWGQTDYTVAQHCVTMAEELLLIEDDATYAHWALLHEVAEAFLGDVPTPIKAILPQYKELEESILKRMASCLRLPYPMPAKIKLADKAAMYEEALNFMPNGAYWEEEARKAGVIPSDRRLIAWSMDQAKWRFIDAHKRLLKLRGFDDE